MLRGKNLYITSLTFSIEWLALHLALEKSVIAAQKIATLECKARKCTLLKYFPSFLIFGSFSNQQNIYLPVSPHPTIALNFRIRTQRERSWNYANEYLFPLPLLQALLRLEVSWREREKKNGSVIRELPNDLDVIRIIKIRTKPWWSFFQSESNKES